MKRLLFLTLLLTATTDAAPPAVLAHQGRIAVSNVNHHGPGYFKFALVDGGATETFWTNDGTNTGTPGGEPTAAVTLTVTNGLYSLGLGDAALGNMTAFPPALFSDEGDLHLRTWFSTDNLTFELLAPDQSLASVPFALSAASAQGVVDGGITEAMLAAGSVGSDKLADSAVTTASIATGAVSLEKFSPAYYSGATQTGGSGLDLSNLPGGSASFGVTFDIPFAAGTSPDIILPSGWTLSGAATESGFSATSSFAPVAVDTVGNVGEFTSLAVVNGHPAISYYDNTNDDLKYVIANDASGTSWAAPVAVDAGGIVGWYTSLAVVNGRPAISYYDDTNDDLKYAIANDASGTSWAAPVAVDTAGFVGRDTSLAVVNGRPAISYYDSTNGDLKYAIANDASGTSWLAPVAVDTAGFVGRFTSLAVVNGRPAISYDDGSSGDLKYVIANDAGGTTWAAPVAVDTTGDVGGYTSLAVVNGRPAISYYDHTNGDLKYAIANDASGTSWAAPVAVDTAGFVGTQTSLAVVNGRPAISYYDSTNRDLKYAIANDASGTSWAAPVAVDTTGNVGGYTSLAVVNGHPAIGYWDATNRDLKYALLPAEPEWTASSGEVHPFQAAGVLDGAVTSASIEDGSITSADLADGTISAADLADGTISAADLDSSSIGVWSVNGGDVYRSSGNVGIGTSSPGALLEIEQDAPGYTQIVRVSNPSDPGNGAIRLGVSNPESNVLLSAYGSGAPGFLASAAGVVVGSGDRLVLGTGSGMPIAMYTNNSFMAPQLFIDTDGDVGIGTTVPGAKLHVEGIIEVDQKIQANDNGGLELATDEGTTRLQIADSGRVGIGTPSPTQALEVSGSGTVRGRITSTNNGEVSLDFFRSGPPFTGTGSTDWRLSTSGDNLEFQEKTDIDGESPDTHMTIKFDGNVGIGTSNPLRGKLVVNGSASTEYTGYHYLEDYDLNFAGPSSGGTADTRNEDTSIYATDRIAGSAFISFSDERIKDVEGVSDGAQDLAALSAIEVTDYTYTDKIGKGSRSQKKLIAQQVEKFYPLAVSQSTDVVPDIYERAAITADGWIELATDLKPGERVKLIGENEDGIHEVLSVRDGVFRTAFQPEGGEKEKIFVYGREVDDFRTVDYDAISMLNVSATQELHRRLEAQETENAALRERLEKLESLVKGLAAEKEREARTVSAN